MKKLTISDLATILQLDQAIKADLEKNFKSYHDNTKDTILMILWNGVHKLEKEMARLKYEQLLLEIDEGKRQLTSDLYQEAVKKVWQDFEDLLSGKSTISIIDNKEIEEIRSELQKQMNKEPETSINSPVKVIDTKRSQDAMK